MAAEERSSDDELFAVLDDLGAQAEAVFAEARRAELSDRAHTEYLHVTLGSRLMAEVGRTLSLHLEGTGTLHGILTRVASGWIEVDASPSRWIVRQAAITSVRDVGERSVAEAAWPVTARLRLPSPVRRLAAEQALCLFHHRDGTRSEGRPIRVGQDFIEVSAAESERRDLIAIPGLAAIQVRDTLAR